jgi:hypothetical protein
LPSRRRAARPSRRTRARFTDHAKNRIRVTLAERPALARVAVISFKAGALDATYKAICLLSTELVR